MFCCCVFFFKQTTAYEMRISDWSSTCALPISYSAPVLPVLLSVTQGAGLASSERQPIIARSSASNTVCGRACGLNGILMDNPWTSLGRQKLMLLGLAAKELGLTGMLSSEDRRVGKVGVDRGRSRGSTYHKKKK